MLDRGAAAMSREMPMSDTRAGAAEDVPLAGRRVLLLEDEFIIALDAEEIVSGLGAESIDTVGSIAAAHEALARRDYDLALLDININGEMSYGVAEACAGKGTVVLFASGYELREPPLLNGMPAPAVTKPYTRETLRQALKCALRPASTGQTP